MFHCTVPRHKNPLYPGTVEHFNKCYVLVNFFKNLRYFKTTVSQLYSDKMKERKQVEKTANKDRQFFQQGEKVSVPLCPGPPTMFQLSYQDLSLSVFRK